MCRAAVGCHGTGTGPTPCCPVPTPSTGEGCKRERPPHRHRTNLRICIGRIRMPRAHTRDRTGQQARRAARYLHRLKNERCPLSSARALPAYLAAPRPAAGGRASIVDQLRAPLISHTARTAAALLVISSTPRKLERRKSGRSWRAARVAWRCSCSSALLLQRCWPSPMVRTPN
jgi:hypothetical protein